MKAGLALTVAALALLARPAHAQTITGRVVVVSGTGVEVSVTGDAGRLRAGDPGYLSETSGERVAKVEVQSVSGRRVKAKLVRWTRAATVGLKAEFTASGASSATQQPVAGGPEVPGDASRGPDLLKEACDRGEMEACSSLGSLFVDGTGVVEDEVRAGALFERACDGGNRSGCARLAWLVERRVTSGQHALKRASIADDRAVYEEALRDFEQALAWDPTHAEALAGRADATRRIDDLRDRSAAVAFVQGEPAFTASPVAADGVAAARLVIEAAPPIVRPGGAYVLRYSLVNLSAASLAIGTVSVRNALGGGGVTGGGIEPRTRTVAPKSRALLVETRGTWSWDPTTEWASTLTVVLEDGSVYSSTLRAKQP